MNGSISEGHIADSQAVLSQGGHGPVACITGESRVRMSELVTPK